MTNHQAALTNQLTIHQTRTIDLAGRTQKFASDCRKFIRDIEHNVSNIKDCKQLVRSTGSVAANYLEADEALSQKDFVMRIKICRKEALVSQLRLSILAIQSQVEQKRTTLADEAYQLVKIFNAIVEKSS